jgi:polyisoprenoid-binding protein YceI
LYRAGWSEVLDFREGLSGWRAAGFPVEEVAAPAAQPPIRSGVHGIDLKESRVLWTGRNLLNRHEGTIPLQAGELTIEAGRLASGRFTFDMRGITCSDLAGGPMHDILIAHLLNDDFFDAEVYPEASFVITQTSPAPDASAGAPDLIVSGELTLKGITRPVEFHACTGITPEGKLAAQATFAMDRTKWNVVYGSGKFFRNLGGHLVNDLIDLNLRIVTV